MDDHAQLLLALKRARVAAEAAVRERQRLLVRQTELEARLNATRGEAAGELRATLDAVKGRIAELGRSLVDLETERRRIHEQVDASRAGRNVRQTDGNDEPGAPRPGTPLAKPAPGTWKQPPWGPGTL